MEGLFSIVWVAVILVIVFRVVKKKSPGSTRGQGGGNPDAVVDGNFTGASHPTASADKSYKPPMGGSLNVYQGGASGKTMRAERATHTLMENRNSDWLAEELRDEKRALYRINAMFGQQMEHKQICDARMLKEYHLEHCSAGGIDTGTMK